MSDTLRAGPGTDMRNRRIIEIVRSTYLGYGLHHDTQHLLDLGTDSERADYVRLLSRRLKLLAFAICVVALCVTFAPRHPTPTPIAPTTTEAGNVVSIQFHDTAFSNSTSVVTSAGTFQVSGAVTATPGDVASFIESVDIGNMKVKSLCIESQFKNACYRVL